MKEPCVKCTAWPCTCWRATLARKLTAKAQNLVALETVVWLVGSLEVND